MNEITMVTKETPIKELLNIVPEAEEILLGYGLHCVGCHFSDMDTLEDGAMMHGLTDEDIELMIRDVNEILRSKNG